MTSAFLAIAWGLLAAIGAFWWFTVEPRLLRRRPKFVAEVSPARLERDVRILSGELGPRDYAHPRELDEVVRFIVTELRSAGVQVSEQAFEVEGLPFKNVVGIVGPQTKERIVVGAHFDTCGPLPGADDNASGVAALLELARVLAQQELPLAVELVAYNLEEPPFFGTEAMGSAIHADELHSTGKAVRFMVSLEMLGFFSDAPNSQRYPSRFLEWLHPGVGDFITVVGTFGQKRITSEIREKMAAASSVPVRSITASRSITGIDYSDHRNYWNRGYPAVMVTDTSFFRNPHYHTETDTFDTLDYERMAEVVRGVANAIVDNAPSPISSRS
ncbi:MAG: M28 family peptidase [Deltaproteobacteria bacterium]|nr:M28 family peptidase [Deltaproteobacteria bacterium]